MSSVFKTPVHIEAAIKPECSHANSVLIPVFAEWIKKKCAVFQNGPIKLDDEIASVISSIKVADLPPNRRVSFWQADVCLHLYRLCDQGPEEDFLEGEEELPAAEQWELPNALLNNLWDSIIIDAAVKNRLLSYCSSSIQFSEARVDTDIISWNRMILLHGPPGTGKTTICKGLAQKTFVRNSDRFSSGMLLEINSHSLFSKWFSESGKLVMKLFAHIGEIADDEECMVVSSYPVLGTRSVPAWHRFLLLLILYCRVNVLLTCL
jgi:Cdc6-like AAA superfamily ATPase